MSFAANLLQNPWIISILGGAIVVVLVWGYSLFQRASIQSMQIARNGETTEEEDLSLYYYSSPPFLPCFALGAVVSYLVWYVLQKTGVSRIQLGGALAKASDIALPGGKVEIDESTISATVSHVVDAMKQVVAPAPIMKGGMPTF